MVVTLDLIPTAWYTNTDAMGNLDPRLLNFFSSDDGNDERKAEANAKVTFEADRHITVNLGSEWSRTNNSDW